MESAMVELSQSFNDMPAWRAAASALSRTDGSMPSTLHDTREFMLSSGFDSGASPAPSASPRVPEQRQSNSAQVVCLWHRLFRVTVNNRLRNRSPGRESCSAGANGRIASAATACRPGHVVAMAAVIGVLISLGALGPGNGLGSIFWNCVIAALQNLA